MSTVSAIFFQNCLNSVCLHYDEMLKYIKFQYYNMQFDVAKEPKKRQGFPAPFPPCYYITALVVESLDAARNTHATLFAESIIKYIKFQYYNMQFGVAKEPKKRQGFPAPFPPCYYLTALVVESLDAARNTKATLFAESIPKDCFNRELTLLYSCKSILD